MMTDKRVTMIKPMVGKVKSPSYSLPDNDFVYGIESQLDKENAGENLLLISTIVICVTIYLIELHLQLSLLLLFRQSSNILGTIETILTSQKL